MTYNIRGPIFDDALFPYLPHVLHKYSQPIVFTIFKCL